MSARHYSNAILSFKNKNHVYSNTFAKIPDDFFDRHICRLAHAATTRYGAKIFPFENWRWYCIECVCLLSLISAALVGIVASRKYGAKRVLFALGMCGFVFVLILLILYQQNVANKNAVMSGAFTTLDHLSIPNGIERVTVSGGAYCSDVDDCRCYYAQLYILYGTHFPAAIAFDKFIQQLQTSGWIPEGTEYPESRGFIQGDNAYLNLDHNGGSAFLWRSLDRQGDYVSATEKYSGTLNMRIDYML